MNIFSSTCEYAFRALAELAGEQEEAVLGRDLAERAGVPANYLAKILLTLKRAGIVEATRGTGGGYRLGRPAQEIVLAEVVELLDPPRGAGSCFLGGGRKCAEESACPGHDRWKLVKEAYREFVDNTTLSQISPGSPSPPEATR